MQLSARDIAKIKKQFISNKQSIERAVKRIEIIAQENDRMMKLLSEVKETESVLDSNIQKILARRHALIKNK